MASALARIHAEPRLPRPRAKAPASIEVADALGMRDRVGDGHGRALRHAEQRKSLLANGFDHGFEVAHEGIERHVVDVPVRQAVAARVVADELMLGRDGLEERTQTGLSQSYSRWFSQFAVLITGGPAPTDA